MNPEMMTVISMRQKEMSYQHLTRTMTTTVATAPNAFFASVLPMATPPPVYLNGAATFALPSLLHASSPVPTTPSGYCTQEPSYYSTKGAMARACYSPLSVGQMPHSGSNYDQFGFVWHWISKVCAHFALQRQAAHFAIQYAQRLLRQRTAAREDDGYIIRNYDDIYTVQKELQVLGITCVMIAAKIEEVHPPKASDFAEYMTEHGAVACSADDMVLYEAQALVELKWNLHPTTVLSWLLFLLAGDAGDQPMETMGDFVDSKRAPSVRKDVFAAAVSLIDAALLDYQSMDFLPSVLAGSAILLADPGLDLVYVAQFLQLDPSLLWECKNWLFVATNGLVESSLEGSRNEDRWSKVPREEVLFIQTAVPVPNHLAFGLLRVENTTYDYVNEMPSQVDNNTYGGYSNYLSPTPTSSSPCDTYGCYCNDGFHGGRSAATNVYHFKYGWQGADMGYDGPTVQRKLHFS